MKILNLDETIMNPQNFEEAEQLNRVLYELVLQLALEAGYTTIHSHWGHNAHDEHDLKEAYVKMVEARQADSFDGDMPF